MRESIRLDSLGLVSGRDDVDLITAATQTPFTHEGSTHRYSNRSAARISGSFAGAISRPCSGVTVPDQARPRLRGAGQVLRRASAEHSRRGRSQPVWPSSA
jgi:hypothetical protein